MNGNTKAILGLLMIQVSIISIASGLDTDTNMGTEVIDATIDNDSLYDEIITRSRANRGFTNNGTIIYNYNEIVSECDDECLTEENLGNITLDRNSHVREIHNRIIIDDGIQAFGEDVYIGNITIDRNGSIRNIQNRIRIDGDITSNRDEIRIGDVDINRGGSIEELQNFITIEGDVDAR